MKKKGPSGYAGVISFEVVHVYKSVLPVTIFVAMSFFACLHGSCQTATNEFTERVRINRPETPRLNGGAEQNETIDPPFTEVPSLIETPPIKGRASAVNWMLMPNVGHGTFTRFIQEAHPDFDLSTEKTDPNNLLEIIGEHEIPGSKKYLTGMACRRILMDGAFIQGGVTRKLLAARPPKVLVYEIDCSCSLQDPTAIRQYVQNGGYLIVTGRNINGIADAFPDRVTTANGALPYDELVDARLYNPDQILCTNLVTNARWYIPAGFSPLKVLNPKAVRVISTSSELAAEIPDGQGVLAAIFPFGRGYVLCISGTLNNTTGRINSASGVVRNGLNEALPDPAPKIHISLRQGITINFIEAGLTQKRIPINGEGPFLKKQQQAKSAD